MELEALSRRRSLADVMGLRLDARGAFYFDLSAYRAARKARQVAFDREVGAVDDPAVMVVRNALRMVFIQGG